MNKALSIFNSKRVILKIGSSLLIKNEKFNYSWLESLIDDLLILKKKKIEILIVASGAVSLGKKYLGIKKNKIKINEKQACAACGQVILMNNFMKSFKKKNLKVAQLLLTFSDTENRKNSLNSRETISSLIASEVIPIINENDTVATEELKFGDNDRLASRVAQITNADSLILLSDVVGLFNKNPKNNKNAKLINFVNFMADDLKKISTHETNSYGSGGMTTKIEAAEIATNFGCNTLICSGKPKNPLKNYEKNRVGTWFFSEKKQVKGFKSWLAGSIKISGSLIIDDGAFNAILKGASLLPSGVKKISGKFCRGDIIEILHENGKKIGNGIIFYDSDEAKKIRGKKTSEIKDILGYLGRDEIVHRDNLTINGKK